MRSSIGATALATLLLATLLMATGVVSPARAEMNVSCGASGGCMGQGCSGGQYYICNCERDCTGGGNSVCNSIAACAAIAAPRKAPKGMRAVSSRAPQFSAFEQRMKSLPQKR